MSQGFAGIVTIRLKPEDVERFKAMALEAADAMSRESEFRHAWVHTVVGDPNTLFVYEAWSCSYDHFVSELRTKPYRHELNAALDAMTPDERQFAILDYVASYPG